MLLQQLHCLFYDQGIPVAVNHVQMGTFASEDDLIYGDTVPDNVTQADPSRRQGR